MSHTDVIYADRLGSSQRNDPRTALTAGGRPANRKGSLMRPTLHGFDGRASDALALVESFDTTECVLWPFSHTGTCHAAYRGTTVARLLIGLERGDGLVARHTCHNAWCVNAAHIVSGTPQDNSDDMKRAGRHRSSGGSLSRRAVPGVDATTGVVATKWWLDASVIAAYTIGQRREAA